MLGVAMAESEVPPEEIQSKLKLLRPRAVGAAGRRAPLHGSLANEFPGGAAWGSVGAGGGATGSTCSRVTGRPPPAQVSPVLMGGSVAPVGFSGIHGSDRQPWSAPATIGQPPQQPTSVGNARNDMPCPRRRSVSGTSCSPSPIRTAGALAIDSSSRHTSPRPDARIGTPRQPLTTPSPASPHVSPTPFRGAGLPRTPPPGTPPAPVPYFARAAAAVPVACSDPFKGSRLPRTPPAPAPPPAVAAVNALVGSDVPGPLIDTDLSRIAAGTDRLSVSRLVWTPPSGAADSPEIRSGCRLQQTSPSSSSQSSLQRPGLGEAGADEAEFRPQAAVRPASADKVVGLSAAKAPLKPPSPPQCKSAPASRGGDDAKAAAVTGRLRPAVRAACAETGHSNGGIGARDRAPRSFEDELSYEMDAQKIFNRKLHSMEAALPAQSASPHAAPWPPPSANAASAQPPSPPRGRRAAPMASPPQGASRSEEGIGRACGGGGGGAAWSSAAASTKSRVGGATGGGADDGFGQWRREARQRSLGFTDCEAIEEPILEPPGAFHTRSPLAHLPQGGTSGSNVPSVNVRYTPYEELEAFQRPPTEAGMKVLEGRLSSADGWEKQFAAIDEVRRIARHVPRLLVNDSGRFRRLIGAIVQLVDSLRSALAKNALRCIGELFIACGTQLDRDLELILTPLLRRAGDTCAFVADEADVALREMCRAATEAKLLQPVLAGAAHRRTEIRAKAVWCLAMLGQRLRLRGTSGARDSLRAVAEAIGKASGDASAEVRQVARLAALSTLGDGGGVAANSALAGVSGFAQLQVAAEAALAECPAAGCDAFEFEAARKHVEPARTAWVGSQHR